MSSQDITSHTRYTGRFGTLTASTASTSHDDIDLGGFYYSWSGRQTSLERAISFADATDISRATCKAFTQTYQTLPNSVVLQTTDNLAHQMATGFDINLDAKLFADLSLRASGSVACTEFNLGALSIDPKQSRLGWNIRGGLDWKPTPDDQIQFNTSYFGKQHYNVQTTGPRFYGAIAVRHRIDRDLSALFNVRNLFESSSDSTVDAPGVHQQTYTRPYGRVFYLGLVYTFGGAQDQTMSVEEGGGPGGR